MNKKELIDVIYFIKDHDISFLDDVDECAEQCLKSINSSRRSERRAIGSNSKAKEVCNFKDVECMCTYCNTKYMLSKGHVCYQQTD